MRIFRIDERESNRCRRELTRLAKQYREAAGKTRAQAARELGIARPSVHQAKELPKKGLFSLRKRIIEAYSPHRVSGPVFVVEKK